MSRHSASTSSQVLLRKGCSAQPFLFPPGPVAREVVNPIWLRGLKAPVQPDSSGTWWISNARQSSFTTFYTWAYSPHRTTPSPPRPSPAPSKSLVSCLHPYRSGHTRFDSRIVSCCRGPTVALRCPLPSTLGDIPSPSPDFVYPSKRFPRPSRSP